MEPIPNILDFKKVLIIFLESINVEYPPGNRFDESFVEVENALNREARKINDYSKEAEVRHALSELTELKFIVNSVNNIGIDSKILKNKFKIVISGERPVNKKSLDKNDASRNTIFELLLFSYLHGKSFDVYYEEKGDILLLNNGKKIIIECKRINGDDSRKSLKNLLRKANRQILKEKDSVDFGLIAININHHFFRDGKLMLSMDKDSAKDGFHQMIKEFISEYGDMWQRRNIVNSADLVPAVLVCLNGTIRSFEGNETANGFFTFINNTSTPPTNNFKITESVGIHLK